VARFLYLFYKNPSLDVGTDSLT